MLATLGGILALLLGLVILLLPLLATELSRPRDSFWGAVVLLLGLVLVTTTERLTGAPMLAVLSGGLLIGRLGSEVGLARWRQLTPEEQRRLGSAERWRSSLGQLAASCARLLGMVASAIGGVGTWIAERRQPRQPSKRWVRPEASPPAVEEESGDQPSEATALEAVAPLPLARPDLDAPPTLVVKGFEEIDTLLSRAGVEPLEPPLPPATAAPIQEPHQAPVEEREHEESPAGSASREPDGESEVAGAEVANAGGEEAGGDEAGSDEAGCDEAG